MFTDCNVLHTHFSSPLLTLGTYHPSAMSPRWSCWPMCVLKTHPGLEAQTLWPPSLGTADKQKTAPKAQTWTDVRVGAVQLGQAGNLQELLPLRYWLRPGGFRQRGHTGQGKSAGRPPAHVGTELICRAPYGKKDQSDKSRKKLKMNLKYLLI